MNGCPVSVEELRAKAVQAKDYKTIFLCADDSKYYDDLLKHLLADDLEYVDYELEHSCNYYNEEDNAKRRKSLLITYALRVSDWHGETANREELTRLVEGGKLKEFILKAFERLVLKLRANEGCEDGAEELLRAYLDKLEGDCYDMDGDYYISDEYEIVNSMYECRRALFEVKPLPEVCPEQLFAFIDIIEGV